MCNSSKTKTPVSSFSPPLSQPYSTGDTFISFTVILALFYFQNQNQCFFIINFRFNLRSIEDCFQQTNICMFFISQNMYILTNFAMQPFLNIANIEVS